ncbi:MAG: hypothetical protein ACM3KR_07795 [Deltaproteobacteria bacterium]
MDDNNKVNNGPELKDAGDLMNAVKDTIDLYRAKESLTKKEKEQMKIALHLYGYIKGKLEEEPEKAERELKPRYFRSEEPIYFVKTGVREGKDFDVVAVTLKNDNHLSMDRFNACNAALGRMLKSTTPYPVKAQGREDRE